MDILVAAHSGLRWLVLLALIATVVAGFTRTSATSPPTDRWLSGVSILFDLQVTIGVVLYLIDQGWEQGGFIGIFHPLAMLAAIAVFHVGLSRGRQDEGGSGWRTVAVMTLLSLVLVLAGVPWQRGMI
ncbi:MAG: hypothetical protein ACLFWM_11660 [Actinomycetota bacterium]